MMDADEQDQKMAEYQKWHRLAEIAAYEQAQDDCETRQYRRYVWLGVIALCLVFWTVVWVVVA